jgi:hypothetical protein
MIHIGSPMAVICHEMPGGPAEVEATDAPEDAGACVMNVLDI